MNSWNKYPGFRIFVPFILGIICGVELGINTTVLFWLGILLFLFLLVTFYFTSFKNRKLIGVLAFSLIFVVGWQYTISRTEKYQQNHFIHSVKNSEHYTVIVTEPLIEKENSYRTFLQVRSGIGDSVTLHSGKLLAYFKKNKSSKQIQYGDQLIIKNRLQQIEGARNPHQFDYRNYLNLNQMNYQVFLDSNSWRKLENNSANPLVKFSQLMREKLYGYLETNGVEGNQLKVASALLLGYRENLDKDLVKSYSSAGAMHVLAVSGLHVGILYLLLSNLLKLFSKVFKNKYLFAFILIGSLWFYALMTGMSASVMRSSTMFTFIIIGDKLLNRSASIYNTLAVSALILMLVDPYVIYQVGFQLSYAAVLGIVYLQPKIYRLIYMPNVILQKIWAITCVSIAAQIATFPLSLHYFHQFPVYFFISNLIVIPAAILIFYLGVALFVTAPIGGVSLAIGKLLNGILMILNEAVYFTEELSYSLIEEIALTFLETYWLYGIIISFLFSIYYRKIKLIYLTLTLVVGFVGFQLVDQYSSIEQKRITFYSINKETVFEFVKGKSVYFVSSAKLKNDWSTLLFNVNNNWNNQNVTKKIFFNSDSLDTQFKDNHLFLNNGFFYFDLLSVLYPVNNRSYSEEIDYLVVSKKNLKLAKKIIKETKVKTVIFDATVPYYQVKYLANNIDTNTTKVISLNKRYYSVEL